MGELRDFQTGAPLSPPLGPHNTHSGAPPSQGPRTTQTGAPLSPPLGPHYVLQRIAPGVYKRLGRSPTLWQAGEVFIHRTQAANNPSDPTDILILSAESADAQLGVEYMTSTIITFLDDAVPGLIDASIALDALNTHYSEQVPRIDGRKRKYKKSDRRFRWTEAEVAEMRRLHRNGMRPEEIRLALAPDASYSAVYRVLTDASYPTKHSD